MYIRNFSLSLLLLTSLSPSLSASDTETQKAFDVKGTIAIVPEGTLRFEQLKEQSRWAAQDLVAAFDELDSTDICVKVDYSSDECPNWLAGVKHPTLGCVLKTDVLPARLLYNRDLRGNFGTAVEGDLLMIPVPGTDKIAQLKCSHIGQYPWQIALRYELKKFYTKENQKILCKEIAAFEKTWKKKKNGIHDKRS